MVQLTNIHISRACGDVANVVTFLAPLNREQGMIDTAKWIVLSLDVERQLTWMCRFVARSKLRRSSEGRVQASTMTPVKLEAQA
jgi:hypothetical protein